MKSALPTLLTILALMPVLTASAADPKTYAVDVTMTTKSTIATPHVVARENENFKVATGEDDDKMTASLTIVAVAPNSIRLTGSVRCADAAAVSPNLVVALGETAKVEAPGPAALRCQLSVTTREDTNPATSK